MLCKARAYKLIRICILLLYVAALLTATVHAAPTDINIPSFNFSIGPADTPQEASNTLQILFLLTVLSLAPSILIMMTAFTRIIIVLSFVRNAIGLQQMPPNQVLIGLALFLTFFVMSPVVDEINTKAYQPLMQQAITQEQAYKNAMAPIKNFMLKQIQKKDLTLFLSISKTETPQNVEDLPLRVVIPAFITSELARGFKIGLIIFIPFIIIDMIVSSTLMTMGMMMLPPMMISLPFKILLFVMVDGWGLIIKTLITGFN